MLQTLKLINKEINAAYVYFLSHCGLFDYFVCVSVFLISQKLAPIELKILKIPSFVKLKGYVSNSRRNNKIYEALGSIMWLHAFAFT